MKSKYTRLFVLLALLWVNMYSDVVASLSYGSIPDIGLSLVKTECKADGTYELKIRVNYSSSRSAAFLVELESAVKDTFSYANVASGDTICIQTGLRGDETAQLKLTAVDTQLYNRLHAHPFFSEWHYDNRGADVDEFIEISGPSGKDLNDYKIYVYDADGSIVLADSTDAIADTLPGALGECGALALRQPELSSQFFENGNEAVALVHTPTGQVVDFISHEGVISPAFGPASGMSSIDIGIEPSNTPLGQSLQLTNTGWSGPVAASPGVINTGFTCPYDVGVVCLDTLTYTEPYCIDCGSVVLEIHQIAERIIHCSPTHNTMTSIAPTASVRPGELFLSEYIEGPSGQNNKCLEIYNGTDHTIDLSSYSLQLYNTAPRTSPNRSLSLTGSIAPDDVYVICNNGAFISEIDLVDNYLMLFNGDDIITLSKNGRIIDAIGRIGEDPGSSWSSGAVSTANRVMRRKPTVYRGDDRAYAPFDPSADWIDGGVNDPSDLGRHTCLPAPVSTFRFYDNNPAVGGKILTDGVAMMDTLVTMANSPTTIWVTAYLDGQACESNASPVSIAVHPEESTMSCLGSVNININAQCEVPNIISTAFLGSYDPLLLDINYSTTSGTPISASELYQYRGERVVYEVIDSCTLQTCWGYAHIESKAIFPTIHSIADTICCGTQWQDRVAHSVDELNNALLNGCYADHDSIWVHIMTSGALCDTLHTIVEYYTDFDIHKRKQRVLLYTDTLLTVPVHLDDVVTPGSSRVLDSMALVDTIVIPRCSGFNTSPDSIMRYWAESIDPGDRHHNGDNEGVPFAYPYVIKDSVVIYDTTVTINVREVTKPGRLVRIGDIWTRLNVVEEIQDTTIVVEKDTIAVYHPLNSTTTCNINSSYSDQLYPQCHPDDRILRTWSITDWCHGVKRQNHQWIIVEDSEEPIFGVLPVDIELVGVDSAIVNRSDTVVHISQIGAKLNIDEILQIAYVRNPIGCTADLLIPRFKNFKDNCTPYEDIEFEYSFDVVGPYEDIEDRGLIRNLPLGVTEITINATDECGNKAQPHTLIVVTLDGAPPRPVCHDTIRISLTQDYQTDNGVNRIPLSLFDNGTVDDCGEILLTLGFRDDFKFTCGGDPLRFVGDDYVEVCCEDINKAIPIELTYFDLFGNSAQCESVMIIEDKVQPRITCDTVRLLCTERPSESQLRAAISIEGLVCDEGLSLSFGAYLGPQACGGGSEEIDIYHRGQYQCAVHVEYVSAVAFDPYSIKWPVHRDGREGIAGVQRKCKREDGTLSIVESAAALDHYPRYTHSSEVVIDKPIWCDTDCSIIQATYVIDTVSTSSDYGKIIHRWTIIDWCGYQPNSGEVGANNATYELVDDSLLEGDGCVMCYAQTTRSNSVYYRYKTIEQRGIYTYDQVIVAKRDTGQMIAGRVTMMDDRPVSGASVMLVDDAGLPVASSISKESGDYGIRSDDVMSGIQAIKSRKNDDHLNGVSIMDVLVIQRHILGIEPITDPEDLIAADANADGQINIVDEVQLRQLILGKVEQLPDQDSWLIFPSEYSVSDLYPPYQTSMERPMDGKQDFSAIKIGDVADSPAYTRYAKPLALSYDQSWEDGDWVITFYTTEVATMTALQLQITLDNAIAVNSGQINIEDSHLSDDGDITIAWCDAIGVEIDEERPLFSIRYSSPQRHSVRLSTIARSEIHTREGEGRPIEFQKRREGDGAVITVSPNPFTQSTQLQYHLDESTEVSLLIWSSDGRVVIRQSLGYQHQGSHSYRIRRTEDMQSGVYHYCLRISDQCHYGRLLIVD